jgi:beta-lactamase superfamily II metal-dependent hydrolase
MTCLMCNGQHTVISCTECGHNSVFCFNCFYYFDNWNKCCPVAGCHSQSITIADDVDPEEDEGQTNLSSNSSLMNAYSKELENYDNSMSDEFHFVVPCSLNEMPARAAIEDAEAVVEKKDNDEEKMEDVSENEEQHISIYHEEQHISIYHLDVGMGDSTLIVDWQFGNVILIDCGSTKNADVAGAPSLDFIVNCVTQAADISGRDPTIDMVYFTHPDRDHYNMFPDLVKLFKENPLRVMQFTVGASKRNYTANDVYKQYLSHVNVTDFAKPVGQQDLVKFNNFTTQVLCANLVPLHKETLSNAASLCILLEVFCVDEYHKLLFMGDGEITVEQTLLKNSSEIIKDCLALKIGHHGSEKSCTEDFLKIVQPRFVFVSADMTWSHPYTSTMQPLIELPSLNRTLENDPPHTIVHGDGGSRKRSYQTASTRSEVYTNIVEIHSDHSDSQAAKQAQKAGDHPVEAIGVRHDLNIELESGAVQHDSSDKDGQDAPWENIYYPQDHYSNQQI